MSNWKDKIGSFAPILGKALGAVPVVGGALEAVSDALLGHPNGTEDELEARVTNWTDADELALKTAEQAFTASMIDKAVAIEQLNAADRASARQREVATKDWTPRILALALTVGFFSLLTMMSFHPVPAANKDVLNTLLGALGGAWLTVVTYYFGGSQGSDVKTAILGRVAEKKS